MSDERSSKRPKIENEDADANEILSFLLQSNGEELKFKPEMCHQLFGDEEVIHGHLEPSARVLIDHRSYSYTVAFKSKQKSSDATKVSLKVVLLLLCLQKDCRNPEHLDYESLYTVDLLSDPGAHCIDVNIEFAGSEAL